MLFVITWLLFMDLGLTLAQISRPLKNDRLVPLALRIARQNDLANLCASPLFPVGGLLRTHAVLLRSKN